ncbi:hypothetical protein KAR52_01075 [Candidatus Pacearchaeota archaeon]|nr:hypothetical protein [Candidatus Pacearchaeota archaeon]
MKKKQRTIVIVLIFLLTINIFVLYSLIEFKSLSCIFEDSFSKYVSGEVIIDFVQDTTKEEVDSLLSSYGLASNEIRYPAKNEYRIDFTGDEDGFLEYLNQNGFTREPHRIPSYYMFNAEGGINCKKATEIANNFPGVIVTNVYCFGHVWGVIDVRWGTERYWMCKLRKSDIVRDTDLNGIISMQYFQSID